VFLRIVKLRVAVKLIRSFISSAIPSASRPFIAWPYVGIRQGSGCTKCGATRMRMLRSRIDSRMRLRSACCK
jgi:hypothetical protein